MFLASLLLAVVPQCFGTTPNSNGAGAVLSLWPPPFFHSITWSVTGLPYNTVGCLFVSNANIQPGIPFGQGTLCIALPVRVRYIGSTGPGGFVTGPIPAVWPQGTYIQYWYRDQGNTISSNTQKCL